MPNPIVRRRIGKELADSGKYYLYDKFTTDVAAGSVNGTLADVGGARTVTDTASHLSIAGGQLVSDGGAGASDPSISWQSKTRVAGRSMFMVGTTSTRFNTFGFHSALPPTNGALAAGFRIISNVLYTFPAVNVGAWVNGTAYKYAVVLRSSGYFVFIKGGLFTNWTLLNVIATDSTATVHPGIDNDAAGAFTADNIRIPKRLWLPSPLASDGFSTALTDGLGHAEGVAGGLGAGGAGLTWTGATWSLSAGKALNTPTEGAGIIEGATLNGNFAAWTADDPDDWAMVNQTGEAECSEVGTGEGHGGVGTGMCNLYRTTTILSITQAILTIGNWYRADMLVDTVVSGSLLMSDVLNGIYNLTNSTGTLVTTGRAAHASVRIRTQDNPTDITIDDVIVKELTLSTLFKSLTVSTQNAIATTEIVWLKGTQAGLVLNLDSAATPANFIIAYLSGATCKLDKCVAGVYTNVISAVVTYVSGAQIRVIKDGTSYRLFYNNLAVGAVSTVSDAGIVDNKIHGLFSTFVDNTFDNFTVYARGNSGEYSALDGM